MTMPSVSLPPPAATAAETAPLDGVRRSIRRHALSGSLLALALLLGVGGFAVTVPLSSAVIAPGTLIVESIRKKIQHQDGGIVAEIAVKDGDRVAAGDLLIRLDDTAAKANLGIIEAQIDQLEARLARLSAERDGAADLEPVAHLAERQNDPSVAQVMAGERRLLAARRDTLSGQKAQLSEKLAQMDQTIIGLSAQENGRRSELKVVAEELVAVLGLYKSNLVTVNRVHELQRDQARLEGEIGALVAQAAETRGRMAEVRSQLLTLEQQQLSDVMRDLRDAQSSLAPLYERQVAARDQLQRTRLLAPIGGIVHELSVHTVGGVVAPRETVMMIVPENDRLVLEVQVRPQDIDKIQIHDRARLRLLAGNVRTTPEFHGEVQEVSPDIVTDERTNRSYYIARILPDAADVSAFTSFALVPGMPAEAFIDQGDRTMFEYLARPIVDQFSRTFKEW